MHLVCKRAPWISRKLVGIWGCCPEWVRELFFALFMLNKTEQRFFFFCWWSWKCCGPREWGIRRKMPMVLRDTPSVVVNKLYVASSDFTTWFESRSRGKYSFDTIEFMRPWRFRSSHDWTFYFDYSSKPDSNRHSILRHCNLMFFLPYSTWHSTYYNVARFTNTPPNVRSTKVKLSCHFGLATKGGSSEIERHNL